MGLGKTVSAAAAVATIAVSMAYAKDDPSACSRIEDSLQRLNCYDRIFPVGEADDEPGKVDDPVTAEEAIEQPTWVVKETKSPLDDSPTVMAYMVPTNVSGTGIGNDEMFLMLRCQENTTGAVFSTDMFMTGDTARVTYRVGDDQAKTSRWQVATNYKSVGLWSGAQAIPFIKSLRDNERLAVRVESKNRVDAQFNLGNISEVADKIATACHWK